MDAPRKIIISILITLFFLPSFAQELKTRRISTGNYLEIFTIDKSSKLKNGGYLKIEKKTKDTLISGTFRNDHKASIWRYYSMGNKLWISFDYNRKFLLQLSDQINKTDSFMIRQGDAFDTEKVDTPPVYLGFKDEINTILAKNFKIPREILENGFSGNSVASFIVDKNGEMTDFKIVKPMYQEVNANILKAFKKIEGEWLPAIFKGQPVDSKVFLVFDIISQGGSSTIPQISNAIVTHVEYYLTTSNIEYLNKRYFESLFRLSK